MFMKAISVYNVLRYRTKMGVNESLCCCTLDLSGNFDFDGWFVWCVQGFIKSIFQGLWGEIEVGF